MYLYVFQFLSLEFMASSAAENDSIQTFSAGM